MCSTLPQKDWPDCLYLTTTFPEKESAHSRHNCNNDNHGRIGFDDIRSKSIKFRAGTVSYHAAEILILKGHTVSGFMTMSKSCGIG